MIKTAIGKSASYKVGTLPPEWLDKYVAPHISKLSAPSVQKIGQEFPAMGNWIEKFIVFTMTTQFFKKEQIPLAFALIRRAQAAIEDYDQACMSLQKFIRNKSDFPAYFVALHRLETTIAMLYQGFDFCMKALGKKIFKKHDNTAIERLNKIYNETRHNAYKGLPAGTVHLIWVENEGVCALNARLKFGELEDLLRMLGRIADQIANGQRK